MWYSFQVSNSVAHIILSWGLESHFMDWRLSPTTQNQCLRLFTVVFWMVLTWHSLQTPTCLHSSTLKSLQWAGVVFAVCLFCLFPVKRSCCLAFNFSQRRFQCDLLLQHLAQGLGGLISISCTDLFWGKRSQRTVQCYRRFGPLIHAFILQAENIACCTGY